MFLIAISSGYKFIFFSSICCELEILITPVRQINITSEKLFTISVPVPYLQVERNFQLTSVFKLLTLFHLYATKLLKNQKFLVFFIMYGTIDLKRQIINDETYRRYYTL